MGRRLTSTDLRAMDAANDVDGGFGVRAIDGGNGRRQRWN